MQEKNSLVTQITLQRLKQERKKWRQDHPHGFVAKPVQNKDGSLNMLKWQAQVPGPKDSPWEGKHYYISIEFGNEYPIKPPKCQFMPLIPHPNIYPSGTICLSILNEEDDWRSCIGVKQILLGIQKLLKDEPNIESPAQYEPTALYRQCKSAYYQNVRNFVKEYPQK